MPQPSNRACGDSTISAMPATPAAAQPHAALGGMFLPISQPSSRIISVCVELSVAANPPGRR